MEFQKQRWTCLIAAMITAIFIGIIYAFSVFVIPLSNKFKWTTAEVSLAFTLNVVMQVVAPIAFAKLRAKMTIRIYCLIGAILYGIGLILCSVMQNSIWELYLYFGVLNGLGIGMIYVALVTYVVQSFPDKKGLAAGLYTAAYGSAALIWAPVANWIAISTGDIAYSFRYLAVLMTLVVIIATRFLIDVPAVWVGVPQTGAAKTAPSAFAIVTEKRTAELWSMPLMYVTWVLFLCGFLSGMMVLSLGSPILQGSLGYTPVKAAAIVGLFAVSQTVGRLLWGWLSDVIGRVNVMAILAVITLLCAIVLATIKEEALFIAAILIIPSAYSGYIANLSPSVMEAFGTKHFTTNFNVIFTTIAVASLVGPQIVSYVKSSSGGYAGAFSWAAGFACVAILMTFLYRYYASKERESYRLTQDKYLQSKQEQPV